MKIIQLTLSATVLILAAAVTRGIWKERLPGRLRIGFWMIAVLSCLIPFQLPVLDNSALLSQRIACRNRIEQIAETKIPEGIIQKELDTQTLTDQAEAAAARSENRQEQQNNRSDTNNRNSQKNPTSQTAQESLTTTVTPDESTEASNLCMAEWFRILYPVGVVCMGLAFAISYRRYYRMLRESIPVTDPRIQEWIRTCGCRRTVRVCRTDRVRSPFTCGLFRPRLVLPSSLSAQDETCLEAVVTHETVHIMCGDMLIKIMTVCALCIHWFNPCVWFLYAMLNRDLELACDEKTVELLGEERRLMYGMALLQAAGQKQRMMWAHMNFNADALEERMVMLMKRRKHSLMATGISISLMAAALFGVSTAPFAETTDATETLSAASWDSTVLGENGVRLKTSCPEYCYVIVYGEEAAAVCVDEEKVKAFHDLIKQVPLRRLEKTEEPEDVGEQIYFDVNGSPCWITETYFYADKTMYRFREADGSAAIIEILQEIRADEASYQEENMELPKAYLEHVFNERLQTDTALEAENAKDAMIGAGAQILETVIAYDNAEYQGIIRYRDGEGLETCTAIIRDGCVRSTAKCWPGDVIGPLQYCGEGRYEILLLKTNVRGETREEMYQGCYRTSDW